MWRKVQQHGAYWKEYEVHFVVLDLVPTFFIRVNAYARLRISTKTWTTGQARKFRNQMGPGARAPLQSSVPPIEHSALQKKVMKMH